ncbi:MAG: glycosyltransferase family 2 protein [Armatimonadetes bacterium]|nr:glycosyltransferase family 2 protein [Armatimonadota bacterium]
MQVSIIIVSYNCRNELAACLESIESHAAEVEHEVVVVDNASKDGSAELAQRAPRVRVIRNPENRGFAAAVNQGIAIARGEVFLLLNPDCLVLPGAVDSIYRFLHARPWVGACAPRILDEQGAPVRSCRRFPSLWTVFCEAFGLSRLLPTSSIFNAYEPGGFTYDQPRRVDWASGAALAIRRSAWQLVGPFDESFFIYAEELDWLKRMALRHLECWFVPDAEIVHGNGVTWGKHTVLRALWAHWSMWRYFRKHHGPVTAWTVRALTALGSLGRLALWTCMAASPKLRSRAKQALRLHCAVLAQCFTGRQPPKPS